MKKFRVVASYVTYCTAEIEAESREEAWEIAINMDGGDFYYQATDDWDVSEVKEITEEASCAQ
jgi:hypothetical protein